MNCITAPDYKEMSSICAHLIAEEIRKKADLNFAVPTGGTPVGTLEELVRIAQSTNLDLSRINCFNIDEYIALGKDHPQGYYCFLDRYLYRPAGIDQVRTFVPDVFGDLQEECRRYEQLIRDMGGFDLILLGIGEDGHIGFNEPAPIYEENVHVTDLDSSTVKANARFFEKEEDVPRQAVTLGMGTILKSAKIILIASGKKKAKAIRRLLDVSTIDPTLPASFLRLHRDVTIIIDSEARGQSVSERSLP